MKSSAKHTTIVSNPCREICLIFNHAGFQKIDTLVWPGMAADGLGADEPLPDVGSPSEMIFLPEKLVFKVKELIFPAWPEIFLPRKMIFLITEMFFEVKEIIFIVKETIFEVKEMISLITEIIFVTRKMPDGLSFAANEAWFLDENGWHDSCHVSFPRTSRSRDHNGHAGRFHKTESDG